MWWRMLFIVFLVSRTDRSCASSLESRASTAPCKASSRKLINSSQGSGCNRIYGHGTVFYHCRQYKICFESNHLDSTEKSGLNGGTALVLSNPALKQRALTNCWSLHITETILSFNRLRVNSGKSRGYAVQKTFDDRTVAVICSDQQFSPRKKLRWLLGCVGVFGPSTGVSFAACGELAEIVTPAFRRRTSAFSAQDCCCVGTRLPEKVFGDGQRGAQQFAAASSAILR